MVRFKGGELLQQGRGIGGLLRLVKSVFRPLIRTAGKTIVKAAKSDVGKHVLKNLKEQAIESGAHLTSAALTLIRRGGANMPHRFSNAYSSGTISRIDLKPGCKFEFVRCLEV